MRAITAVFAVRPSGRVGDRWVQGPDEDGFTLAVAALEGLEGTRSIHPDRLFLVGELPPMADWGIGEILGGPPLDVRHFPGTTEGLFAAWHLAGRDGDPERPTLVVVTAVSERSTGVPLSGAGAIAFRFDDRPGLVVKDHRRWAPARSAISESPPESRSESLAGATVLVSDRAPRAGTTTGGMLHHAPRERSGWGRSPVLVPAAILRELFDRLPVGSDGQVEVAHEGGTDILQLLRTGAVAWTGTWGPPEGPDPAQDGLGSPHGVEPRLDAVSEGAYVPYPRYRENLPSRWRFASEHCGACGTVTFPPRGFCRRCDATQGLVEWLLPRDGGTVVASTVIAPGAQPTEFDAQTQARGAYQVVLVEIGPGARVTLQVADAPPGSIGIGQQVGTRLRRLYPMEGEWRYGRKAVPFSPEREDGGHPPLEAFAMAPPSP